MSSNPYAKRSQMTPAARAVRAYAAPVDRSLAPSRLRSRGQGQFDLDAPRLPLSISAG